MSATQEAEFLRAYDENADALFRFVCFRIRDKEQSLDIVQETYLKTWRYLVDGHEIDHIRAFLYRTAKNLLIDISEQKKVRNIHSLDAFIEAGGDVRGDEAGSVLDQLDGERALLMLNELEPPEYKEAVYLRFVEELKPSEIAEILGVSENVASVRINRGIKKLRSLFPS